MIVNVRGTGLKLHGRNGLAENNSILNCTFGGIEIGYQAFSNNTDFIWAENLTVRNNRVEGASVYGLQEPRTLIGWEPGIRIHQGPDHFKGRVCYVNVLCRMSVDCDCTGKAAQEPSVPDIGIFASLDLLAVEQASVDAVYELGQASAPLRERIESRHGLRQLSAMREIGLGSEKYSIVDLDKA